VNKLFIAEGLFLCLKNGVINLFGIAIPLVISNYYTDANPGKCADLAKGMPQQLLLQLLASIILI
jgi:hypothetical protein